MDNKHATEVRFLNAASPIRKIMIKKFRIGEPFNRMFEVNIRVSSDGMFTCTIPKDISALFLEHGVRQRYNRIGNMGYYESETLVGLCDIIKKDINVLCSEKEISRKKVIRYAIETACTYAKREDGDFEPNCAFETRDLKWSNGTIDRHATETGPFGFQVYANVYEKIEYEYCNGGKRVKYHHLREHKFYSGRMDDPIDWLSSVCSHDYGNFIPKEMDYTPERGMFFVNLYKTIFKINEQIKPFLNEDLLQKAIDSKTKLLGI